MNRFTKIKFLILSTILLIAAISYNFRILPYKAVWLWAPVLVFIEYRLDEYAKKRGMILSDERTDKITGKSAWLTFQATVVFMFLAIVYYDIEINRVGVDARYVVAYLAGFMGIAFLIFNTYYNIKYGVWE